MKDDRIQTIIDNLSWLIVDHARMTAKEQYDPRPCADESDDYIVEHKKWIVELRAIREKFENLVTGSLP